MLISPECYLDEIKKFDELEYQKQLNLIKHAKGQITYYQNVIDGKFDNEFATIVQVDPSPDVHLWWWKEVLNLMKIIFITSSHNIIESFEFSFGGFFLGFSKVFIDFSTKSFFVNELKYDLEDNQIIELFFLINSFKQWKQEYVNHNILDGYSWEIKINDKTISFGVNDIPKNYNQKVNKLSQILKFMENAICVELKP